MNKDDFSFYAEDIGDMSVGLYPMTYFEAIIPKGVIEHFSKEEIDNLHKDLSDIVSKYFEPETEFIISNSIYDEKMAEEERKLEESFKKCEDDMKIQRQLDEDIFGKVDLNQLDNIF